MNKLHTRFFPSKIVTCLLAKAVVENIEENNSEWIDYEKFRKDSFEEVLEISKIIKQYEDENIVSRNERISTGFPAFHEKTFENKEDELKNLLRIKASKERFLEQFVGPTLRGFKQNSNGTISGILNDTGLVQIRKKDDSSLEITLSQNGIRFLMLPNPIIDNQNFKHSISKEEKDFIFSGLGDQTSYDEVNFEMYPDFSNRFFLSGVDSVELKNLFDAELVFFFESHAYFRIESSEGKILIKGKSRLLSLQEIKSLISFAKELMLLLNKKYGPKE